MTATLFSHGGGGGGRGETPNEALRELARRCAGNLTTRQIEQKTGVNRSTLSRLLRGFSVSGSSIAAFAAGLGCDVNAMRRAAGLEEISPRRRDPLEAYGQIVDAAPYLYALSDVKPASAGVRRVVTVDAPGMDMAPGHPVRAVLVYGGCMEPWLQDGDVALVLPPDAATDGDVVVAVVDLAEPVCKRLRVSGGTSWLEPINGEDVIPESRFLVTGVVRHKVSPLRR